MRLGFSFCSRQAGLRFLAHKRSTSLQALPRARSQRSNDGQFHSEEDTRFWKHVLQRVKPGLMSELGELLDPSKPTGLDPDTLKAKGLSVPTMHSYIIDLKRQYPQALIFNQCGSFYDFVGVDAMVAVDVLGINWKSPGGKVPLAGIPVRNLPDQLPELNAKGFSVVVVNQVGDPSKDKITKREVAFVSTPANPVYLVSQTGRRSQMSHLPPPPKLGIMYGRNGCTLYALRQETSTVTAMDGLTLEGLLCQINAMGVAPPILFHQSFEQTEGKKFLAVLLKRIEKDLGASQAAPIKGSFAGLDPCAAFINEVRVSVYRNANVDIKLATVPRDDRPRPPYLSTISQLGLGAQSLGAPSLLDAIISSQAPASCRNWLRTLLLTPPPYDQAHQLHAAVAEILASQQGKYRLEVGLQSDMIMRVLQTQGQVPLRFFNQLTSMLSSIENYLSSPAHKAMVKPALAFCVWESQLTHDDSKQLGTPELLRAQLVNLKQDIFSVVNADFEVQPESESLVDKDVLPASEEGKNARFRFNEEAFRLQREALNRNNLQLFRNVTEGNMHMVQGSQMPDEFAEVAHTYQRFEALTNQLFADVYSKWLEGRPSSIRGAPEIAYFANFQLAAVKIPRSSNVRVDPRICSSAATPAGEHVPDSKTTQAIEKQMMAYIMACEAAKKKANQLVKQLCERLLGSLPSLLLAARMTVMLESLYQHVQYVHIQGWCLPHIAPHPFHQRNTNSNGGSSNGSNDSSMSEQPCEDALPPSALSLKGLRPYYLDATDVSVVLNDVDMCGEVWLLTGANMAGKSTVLRSIAAASLLGVCGLMVPAARAHIPAFQAIMLRNSSGDSAMEGKSSFMMETDDMSTVLQESTAQSLVLMDELGKGTEVDYGTAFAAHMAEKMAARQCTTILATHLHDLVDELADLETTGHVKFMRMGLKPTNISSQKGLKSSALTGLVPTWKLEKGVCTESLALEVARASGISELDLIAIAQRRDRLRAKRARLQALDRCQGGHACIDSHSPNSLEHMHTSRLSSSSGSDEDLEGLGSEQDLFNSGEVSSALVAPSGASPKAVSKAQFDAAVDILANTARHIFEEGTNGSKSGIEPSKVHHLSATQEVPPLHAAGGSSGSAVYLCHYSSGEVYCGQSSALQSRLKRHRTRSAKEPHRGPDTSMSYILVDPKQRKRVETACIRALRAAGIPLTSDQDSKNRNF